MQPRPLTSEKRRVKWGLLILLAVPCVGAFLVWWFFIHPFSKPRYGSYSGPIENGANAYAMYGGYSSTMAFSPDAKFFAYIWSDLSYVRPPGLGSRPNTLTEKVEIRIRAVSGEKPEVKMPLDAVDFRPNGLCYYQLGATLRMAPDSRHLAALCARRMEIVDLATDEHHAIEFPGEYFGGLAWLSPDVVAFSTTNGSMRQFWRGTLKGATMERTKVYEEPWRVEFTAAPPAFFQSQSSPNGRFLFFFTTAKEPKGEHLLLDLETGTVRVIPFATNYQCWKPDSSAVLIHDALAPNHPTFLLNPLTGETTDISADFEKEFGHLDLTLVDPVWTPDGKYVLLYNTSEKSTAIQRGCLVQPHPFKVLLSSDHILHGSPIPGWVLVQGGETFEWMDYSGARKAPIRGWPNYWAWSPDGHHAAKISKRQIELFKPDLPPGVGEDAK